MFKEMWKDEHGQLDSIIGSYSIPGIDFSHPHDPSKKPALLGENWAI